MTNYIILSYTCVISAVASLSIQHLQLKPQQLQSVSVSSATTSVSFGVRDLFSLIFVLWEQHPRIFDSPDF